MVGCRAWLCLGAAVIPSSSETEKPPGSSPGPRVKLGLWVIPAAHGSRRQRPRVQSLARVLQQMGGRPKTCVPSCVPQVGCNPNRSPPEDTSVISVPSCLVLVPCIGTSISPVGTRGPFPASPHGWGLRGAEPQSLGLGLSQKGSVSAPAAPAGAGWKVPTAAVGACPPAKPCSPASPDAAQSCAISGSTLRHVPSAVGTMLKETDLG